MPGIIKQNNKWVWPDSGSWTGRSCGRRCQLYCRGSYYVCSFTFRKTYGET